MKIRMRATAMLLTILLAAQLPFTAFANTTQQEQTQGQIIVVDENGNQQAVTAEQLASGEGLPENLMVNTQSDEAQAVSVQNDTASPASESVPATSESTSAQSDIAPLTESAESDSQSMSASESAPATATSESTSASDSTAESDSQRIDMDLPLVTTTQEQTNRVDMDLPVVQATDQSGQRVDETVPVDGQQEQAKNEETQEEETQEEASPYIYWNPGAGYQVDPQYLEVPKSESDSTSESASASESVSESTSESVSESTSASSSSSDSAVSTAPESTPAASSTPESTPAASSTPESTPAASTAPESTPAASTAPESTPAASSTPESTPAASSTPESTPAASSTPESTPAVSPAPESTPAASSTPESTPAVSPAPESAPAAEQPAPQAEHEAAQQAGVLQQAGQVLDSLNPVQTAYAADSLQPEHEQGFFERVLGWISWVFSPIAQFFKDLAAFALSSNEVPAGDDANTGRSPLAPVKTFDGAMQRARELAGELGITMDQVTIYMMNPLEVATGQQVNINADMAILKAWEGRNYDSDVLFYLSGGVLNVRNTVLTPRVIDAANLQGAGKSLVWVYGGALELENNVSAYGGFTLDFYQQETARLWNAAATLSAEKSETPVIRLGENFAPIDMGYSIQLRESDKDANKLELVQAPYLDELKMEQYAASFTVVGDTADQWDYEVLDAQQDAAPVTMERAALRANAVRTGTASLYAVRAGDGTKIYWNPGAAVEGAPAGNDANTGLALDAPVKTFTKAMSQAQANNTTTIVCMQTINLADDTAKDYLPYDNATGQYQLHGTDLGDERFTIENWLTHETPIVEVPAGKTLSVSNVNLSSASGASTLHSGSAVLRQTGMNNETGTSQSGKIILQDKIQITQGYIEVTFETLGATADTRGLPSPLTVNGQDVTANVFGANLNTALEMRYSPLVESGQTLIDSFTAADGKTKEQLAGEHLLANFRLEKANYLDPEDGGISKYRWEFRVGDPTFQDILNRQQKESNLYLYTIPKYDGIYINSEIGNDENYGASCDYPVATLAGALTRFEEAIADTIAARTQMKAEGATREERDKEYPIPQIIWACTTIEVNDEQSWDWTKYQSHVDEDGQPINIKLQAHYEPTVLPNKPDGIHTMPTAAVKVGAGGKLTIGNGVRISLYYPFDTVMTNESGIVTNDGQWIAENHAINVSDGGTLTVTGDAEIFGASNPNVVSQYNALWPHYPGVGIAVGVQMADIAAPAGVLNRAPTSAGTVTLDAGWTGSIHGFGRGIVVDGAQASLTMNGGTITDNRSDFEGAGVSVFRGAQFTMNGGKITANEAASAGGGVFVDAAKLDSDVVTKFAFNDGEISNNIVRATLYLSGYTLSDPRDNPGTNWVSLWSMRSSMGGEEYFPMGGAGIFLNSGILEMGTATGGAPKVENNAIVQNRDSNTNANFTVSGAGICITAGASDRYGSDTAFGDIATRMQNTQATLAAGTISGNYFEDEKGYSYRSYGSILTGMGVSFWRGSKLDIGAVTISNNELRYHNNIYPDSYGDTPNTLQVKAYGMGLYAYTYNTAFTVDGATIENNSMAENAVEAYKMTVNTHLTHQFIGGGVYIDSLGSDKTATIQNTTIRGNRMPIGAGMATYGDQYSRAYRLCLNNVTLEDNTAYTITDEGGTTLIGSGSGGGVWTMYANALLFRKVTIRNNIAENNGGGIANGDYPSNESYSDYGVLLLEDCIIQGNKATNNGGGIYSESGCITLRETADNLGSLSGNTAARGGGIYAKENAYDVYYNYELNGNDATTSLNLMLAQTWTNTATAEGANLYVEASRGGGRTNILKGRFEGANSIVFANETSKSAARLALDMQNVTFGTVADTESHIYLKNADTRLVLLRTPSDAGATPLKLSIQEGQAKAGAVIVEAGGIDSLVVRKPLADVSGATLYETDTTSFGTTVTDASVNWQSWLTLGEMGLARTSLAGVKRADNNSLTDLALVPEGVYVNGVSGDDNNDGKSPDAPVRTFEKAAELLKTYVSDTSDADGYQPMIYVCDTVTIEKSMTISLPQETYVSERYKQAEQAAGREPIQATIQRYPTMLRNTMFQIKGEGVVVDIQNVLLDGNASNMSVYEGAYILETVNYGGHPTINIGDGARLFNQSKDNALIWLGDANLSLSQTLGENESQTDHPQLEVAEGGRGISVSSIHGFDPTIYEKSLVTLSGDAYITGGGTAITIYLNGAEFVIEDNTLIDTYVGIEAGEPYSGSTAQQTSLTMRNNARIDCESYGIKNLGGIGDYFSDPTWDNVATKLIMEDNSLIRSQNVETGDYSNPYSGAVQWSGGPLEIRMTGKSRIDGNFVSPSAGSSSIGALKIVMGTENSETDAPVITSPALNMGGTSMYLEMNGQSKLYSRITIQGLKKCDTEYGKYGVDFEKNGILVRDQAQMIPTVNWSCGIDINLQSAYIDPWDPTGPWDPTRDFEIVFEEDAKLSLQLDPNIQTPEWYQQWYYVAGIRAYMISQRGTSYSMGDNQKIIFRDNAVLENFTNGGAIVCEYSAGEYQFQNVQILGNAKLIPAAVPADWVEDIKPKKPVIRAKSVTVDGTASIETPARFFGEPSVWGQGVAVAAAKVTLGGSAQIAGAIQLDSYVVGADGVPTPMTLTSAPTGGEGQFKVQVPGNYLGYPVVIGDGTMLTDVSGYLSSFNKTAGYGEAKDVPLAADTNAGTIILQMLYDVYLSTNGKDTNDGSSPAKAVRTFAKAKELLQTGANYGEGSDIIIPDNVEVLPEDAEWSFDEGGYLTNTTTNETWQPLVRRAVGTTYQYPMIAVLDPTIAMRVSNMTIDAGGSDVDFDLSYNTTDAYYNNYSNSQLLNSKEAFYHNAKRKNVASVFCVESVTGYTGCPAATTAPSLYLGANTVIQNLDYTLQYTSESATPRAPSGFVIGAYMADVTIDGAEIKNFHIRSYSHPSIQGATGSPVNSGDSVLGCIVVKALDYGSTLPAGSLTILGGSIHDNSIELTGQRKSLYPNEPAAILATNADFEMSGGEIYSNVITATNWETPGVSQKDTASNGVAAIMAFGGWARYGSRNCQAVISGGSIHDNVNEIGIKAESAIGGQSVPSVEGIIAVGNNATETNNKTTPTLTVTGGTIQNNQARHGAAFYLACGTLTLAGGTISGNNNPNAVQGGEGWLSEYAPVYVRADRGYTQFVLQGSDCLMDDAAYLERGTADVGATVIVSEAMSNTKRIYELYVENARQGDVIVQPDGAGLASVTQYLANFEIHAENFMADIGTTSTMRQVNGALTSTNQMPESACILLFKPVFVDGESGQDPTDIQLETGVVTNSAGAEDTLLGFDPDHPVKTFDAAKLLGQAVQPQHSALGWDAHKPRKDCYIIVSMGEMKNELYTGTQALPADASVPAPNADAENMTFSLSGAARIVRYTNFRLHLGNGQHAGGDDDGKAKWYQYDGIFRFDNPGAVTLQDLTVYGRRTTDLSTCYGEALVQVGNGTNLTVKSGVTLALNNANGTRPGLDGLPENIDARGGALRVEAGGTATIESVTIQNTEAVYGGAIYVEGGATPGQLTVTGTVSIGSSVYLGGGKNESAHIRVTKDFSPGAISLSLELQTPYSGRMIVEYIDGTAATTERQNLFALSQAVTGMYEVIVQGTSSEQMVISQRSVFYLDPTASAGGDGITPATAFNSLDSLYTVLDDPSYDSLTGVLIYVVNPIEIPQGQTVAITNAKYTVNDINHYYSYYQPNSGTPVTLNCQIYFKRYVQPTGEDGTVPAGYEQATNLDTLFDVSGNLSLNGIYLDGHSIELTDENGLTAPATQAQAPLVRVQGTGTLICDTQGIQLNGQNCTVDSTIFSNNVNAKRKTAIVPGTTDVTEASSAGLEVLSTESSTGGAQLKKTRFTGLSLGTQDGAPVIGGTDIYLNGTLTMSENMFMEGTVYLEGHGYAGDSAEAQAAQESSRWINIAAWGAPAQAPFTIVMRDAYTGRLVVRYPKSPSDSSISQDDIAKYKLHDEVTRYYTVTEQFLDVTKDPMNDPAGAQVLILTAPKAIYLDPVHGTALSDTNQQSVGFTPNNAVKTLDDAFKQLKTVSGKVLYIMNTVEVSDYVKINNEYYENAAGTREVMPNSSYITIRRFVKPEIAATETAYDEPTFEGALFSVVAGGELIFSGNVEVTGHSTDIGYGDDANHVPTEQKAHGVTSTAPLVVVGQNGAVRLEDDPNATAGAALINNSNTKDATSGETPLNGGALCILEGGEASIDGGSLKNNQARAVPATQAGGQTGSANGVYNEGRLVVSDPATGIPQNQSITLNGEGVLNMYTMLSLTDSANYELSIMNPSVGRVVAKYIGYSGVDRDAGRYVTDATLPTNLFLVESTIDSSVLELQDWKVLNVTVPEEIFLGVHETSGNTTSVSRVDVNGKDYGAPTYTIKNNGAYTTDVFISGFVENAWQGSDEGKPSMQLAANRADLTNRPQDPLLYLAVFRSGEQGDNQFADLEEAPLKGVELTNPSTEVKLGQLAPTQYGDFIFVGEANQAFMDTWLDEQFPIGDNVTAEERRNHMRIADNQSLNKAAAQYTLHYRIELVRDQTNTAQQDESAAS